MGEPSEATQGFKFCRLSWNGTGKQSIPKHNTCYAEYKRKSFKSNTATPMLNSEYRVANYTMPPMESSFFYTFCSTGKNPWVFFSWKTLCVNGFHLKML